MIKKIKSLLIFNLLSIFLFNSLACSDNHNISELLETIQKDLKTLEKAVYANSSDNELSLSSNTMDQNSEEVLTRHLLKLSEIENQFQDLTNNASDKLEGWIDDQISQADNDFVDDSYKILNDDALYDDWIDNLDIDSFDEFNRMSKRKKSTNSTNERDLDPWI